MAASIPVHDALDLSGPDMSQHHLMTLTTRLDALVRKAEKVIGEIHRLNEQSGAALQRAISGQADSVTALSGTVSAAATDVSGLIDEVMGSLAETREVMSRNEDLVRQLIDGLHDASDHFTEIVEAADGPVGQLIDPTHVTAQLQAALTPVLAELEQSRALLHESARRNQRGGLNPAKLREQVASAVGDLATEIRAEIETLATELHEDRALLTKRVAARRDIDQLRQLIELRQPESTDTDVAEQLRAEVESIIVELRDEAAGIARRLAANSRELEEVKGEVAETVSAVGSGLRRDTEILVGELHDDLALLMKQLITTTQELETIRELVERPPAPPVTPSDDIEGAREAIEAAAVEIRSGVERTVGELHDDLSVLLKRMADNQQEFDELRQAIAALQRPPARADRTESGEVRELVTEVHDDLAVIARQLGAMREQLEQLRTEVPAVDQRTAALTEELRGDVLAGLGAVASDLREEIDSLRGHVDRDTTPPAPAIEPGAIRAEVDGSLVELRDDLAVMMSQVVASQDLVEALRADVTQQVAAGAEGVSSEVKAEFERLRRLLMRQRDEQRSAVPDLNEVTTALTAAVEGAAREVRDDVGLVVEQAAAVQQDLGQLRRRLDQVATASATTAEAAPELAELIRGLTDDVATVVRGLSAAQVELAEVQAAVSEPPPLPDVAGEIAQATEPLHDDLALLARQLGGVREDLAALQSAVTAASADVAAEVDQRTTPLSDDLGVVVRQIVAVSEELAALRSEAAQVAGAAPDVAAEVAAVAGSLHDDLALLFGELTGTRTELGDVRAAVADIALPDVAAEVAVATAPLQEDLSALVRQVAGAREELDELRALAAEAAQRQEPGVDVRPEIGDVRDDLGVLMRQVVETQQELSTLRGEVAEAFNSLADLSEAGDEQDVGIALGDLPALFAEEVRIEIQGVATELRSDLDQLRRRLGPQRAERSRPEATVTADDVRAEVSAAVAEIAARVREEIETAVGGLHDDMTNLMHEVVAGQEAVTALSGAGDSSLAGAEMRAEVTETVAAVAADLRNEIETMINELHDDIAIVMRQVVSSQEELAELRLQLAEGATAPPGAVDQMAADLDRLTQDLQMLRERIPASASAPSRPRTRSPRARR